MTSRNTLPPRTFIKRKLSSETDEIPPTVLPLVLTSVFVINPPLTLSSILFAVPELPHRHPYHTSSGCSNLPPQRLISWSILSSAFSGVDFCLPFRSNVSYLYTEVLEDNLEHNNSLMYLYILRNSTSSSTGWYQYLKPTKRFEKLDILYLSFITFFLLPP